MHNDPTFLGLRPQCASSNNHTMPRTHTWVYGCRTREKGHRTQGAECRMQDDKHKGIEMKWLSGPRTCRFGRRHSDRWSHARSGNFTGCFSSSRTSPCTVPMCPQPLLLLLLLRTKYVTRWHVLLPAGRLREWAWPRQRSEWLAAAAANPSSRFLRRHCLRSRKCLPKCCLWHASGTNSPWASVCPS